jgi:3D (Asp-Asp-Asp) domain-containing protein
MRYLVMCLVALTSFVGALAQGSEPDGTLLSPSLVLPHDLLRLPMVGATPTAASAKPAAVAAKPAAAKPAAPTTAKATPVKPSTSSAKPAAKPTTAAKPAPKPAAAKPAPVVSSRPLASFMLRSTAYNSHASQTDRTPFITATGARTRFGVIALSRDMLRVIPYGSLVRIEDLGAWGSGRGRGTYNRMLSGVLFQVEDTMHPRKVRTVDVWFYSRSQAIQWGARQVKLTVIRRGR